MHNADMATSSAAHDSSAANDGNHPWRSFVRVLLVLLAAMAMVLGGAAIASAHAELESSSPANGAQLTGPPAQIKLVFGENILSEGTQLVAFSADKTPVALTNESVDGASLTANWPAATPPGSYTVSYRVTSADGHPIDGGLQFGYTAAGTSTSAAGSGASTVATASPSGAAGTSQSPEPVASSTAGRNQWWIIAILIVLGVAIGGLIAKVLVNRRAGGGT